MLHARPDYERIQEPDELLSTLKDLLNFHEKDDESEELTKARQVVEKWETILSKRGNPIFEFEPVMLFRAKDELAPSVLHFYAKLLGDVDRSEMAHAVRVHADKFEDWSPRKLPDM